MPRTVTTCHLLPLSVGEYLLIRGDPAYEAYKADLVQQDLHITKLRSGADERPDPTRWRSVEIHFRENPVPPFLRSLVNRLVGKDIRMSLDEHAFATHSAFDPPPRRKQHLPKAIEEILSVESSEWIEMVSPTQCAAAAAQYPPAHASTRRICQCTCWHVQRRTACPPTCRCELHLQHQISCRVFGMGGAIEQAVENGVRDSYGRSAELLDAYLRRGGGDSRGDAVLVEATPDTAGSPNPNPQLYP